jgi:hypothetical protein
MIHAFTIAECFIQLKIADLSTSVVQPKTVITNHFCVSEFHQK